MTGDLPLLLPATGLAIGLIALGLAIRTLVRIVRAPDVARGPLISVQTLQLDRAGLFQLCAEGPHLTPRFRGLSFELSDDATGAPVPLHPILLRTTTSAWSTVRLSLYRLRIDRPGAFTLRTTGLAPDAAADDCAVVIRPSPGVRLPLAIVACVLTAALTIASLVATILTLVPPQAGR